MGYGRYLRRRHHTWFFRWRFPAALASCSISGELTVSLKTGSYPLALQRARLLRFNLERLMTTTPAFTREYLESTVRAWIDQRVWDQEIQRSQGNGFGFFEAGELANMDKHDARELASLFAFLPTMAQQVAGRTLAGQEPLESFATLFDVYSQQHEPSIDLAEPNGRLTARTVLRGLVTLIDELKQTVVPIPQQPQGQPAKPMLPDFKFLTDWSKFSDTKVSLGEWKKEDSVSNAQASPKLFKDLIGDLPVNKIDGGTVADFRLEFLKLPWGYQTKKGWKDLKPSQVIAKISKLNKKAQEQLRRVTPKTANKHVVNLAQYWDHLVTTSKIPDAVKNPFRGKLSKRARGRAAREEHPMWPAELLRELFSTPHLKGCKSIFRRTTPGNEIHRDACFWVTFMGAFTGMRATEACDRKVGDIKFIETEMGTIPYFEIRDSKNPSSARDLPIPGRALDFGYLEYRYYGRDPEEPIYPELIPQGAEKRRSTPYVKWLSYYLKITGLSGLYTFKSLRANVETALRNMTGVNAGWVDEIIGHESDVRRSEGSRYTKAILLTHLRRALDGIEIGVDPYNPSTSPRLDFSHLRYTGPRGVQAPGAAEEIKRYVALAEREMRKKASRRKKE